MSTIRAPRSCPRPIPDLDTLPDDALLPVDDVAAVLHCSSRHVRRLDATRELPALRVGALTRWRVGALRDYIARLASAR